MIKRRWKLLFNPEGHTSSSKTRHTVKAGFHLAHDPERIVELEMTPVQARLLAGELTRGADWADGSE